MEFGPEGKFLATSADGTVSLIPLEGPVPLARRIVFELEGNRLMSGVAVSPNGELLAVGEIEGHVWIGGQDGGVAHQLPGTEGTLGGAGDAVFSPDGRFVASWTGWQDPKSGVFRVWDVESFNQIAVLSLSDDEFRGGSSFTNDGRLLTGTSKGVMAWNVETGDHEILVEADVNTFVASEDGRHLLLTEEGEAGFFQDPAGSPVFFDLDTGASTALATHGLHVGAVALDRMGAVAVTGDSDGNIRVGPATGGEPHLLLGHDGEILSLAIDPLGRWIASGGRDNTVRLWPMPDLSKPPLHTLPRDELIAKRDGARLVGARPLSAGCFSIGEVLVAARCPLPGALPAGAPCHNVGTQLTESVR
jgi:WD40 repeat protein